MHDFFKDSQSKHDFFNFIKDHLNEDTNELLLKLNNKPLAFDIKKAIDQIFCRTKTSKKLSTFIQNTQFIFPDIISSQQASHEAIAIFHSTLVDKSDKVLDMTAGLGIDAMTIAPKCNNIKAIDIDQNRCKALSYNSNVLNITNMEVINADSIQYLTESDTIFDTIFIDPSRRAEDNRRLYNLRSCLPDVITHQPLLTDKSKKLIIKASPMLDITQTLRDLPNITTICAVSVNGECKEVLIIKDNEISNKSKGESLILKAIDLDETGKVIYEFELDETKNQKIIYAGKEDLILNHYILEPSSVIMKLSPWGQICKKYNAKKLDNNSNLFVSSENPSTFPGRVTKIEKLLNKKDRLSLKDMPASVISKNYPLTSDQLRKKLKVKEGDNNFIYGTSIKSKPIILLCIKSESDSCG